jgi:hypothetical protein
MRLLLSFIPVSQCRQALNSKHDGRRKYFQPGGLVRIAAQPLDASARRTRAAVADGVPI